MPQIQKKVQVNLKPVVELISNGERGEEKARNFFSSFDAKTLVFRGSFVKWNEGLGVSGLALVVVSFPPWQSSFPPDVPYLFLFLSGCRSTQVSAIPQIQKKGSLCFFSAKRSEFEAVVGYIEETKEAKRIARTVLSSLDINSFYGELCGMERRQRIGSVRFGVGCSFISFLAKLLSVQRFL
jgi:hypothetical protein